MACDWGHSSARSLDGVLQRFPNFSYRDRFLFEIPHLAGFKQVLKVGTKRDWQVRVEHPLQGPDVVFAQRLAFRMSGLGTSDQKRLDVSPGFHAEIAEDVRACGIAVAEVVKREFRRQAFNQPQDCRAGITGEDEQHAGIGGGQFVEGVFVLDGQAERGGGRDRRGSREIGLREGDGGGEWREVKAGGVDDDGEGTMEGDGAWLAENAEVFERGRSGDSLQRDTKAWFEDLELFGISADGGACVSDQRGSPPIQDARDGVC